METLDHLFAKHFGADAPTILVRAPGRVNLIGEHIDYNGLPVLPMAIQREVRLLLRPRRDRRVRLVDADPAYGPRTFEAGPEIEPYAEGDWGNYPKAAVREMARRYGATRGFDAVVASDIPPAAGLSSSSALVVASALGALSAAGRSVPRLELAAASAEAERYVGTRGGGMDQAICLNARKGTAARVAFDPLEVMRVPVPADWRFVVADSGERAEKSGAAREAYNRRTRESREALRAMRAALRRGGEGGEGGVGHEAGDVGGAGEAGQVGGGAERAPVPADAGYPELLAARPVDRLLETADAVLDGEWLKRFRHVVAEADRVERATRALAAGEADAFGRLMLASHRSLRDDYEVSTDALDELVDRACAAGAHGARLTGAGFGGCVLVLARADRVDRVLESLAEGFYRPRGLSPAADRLLPVRPAAAASVQPAPGL